MTKKVEISLYKIFKLHFGEFYIKNKISSQRYQEQQIYILRLGYQIYINVENKRNIFISIRSYKYFFFAICEIINFTFLISTNKKSETLPVL